MMKLFFLKIMIISTLQAQNLEEIITDFAYSGKVTSLISQNANKPMNDYIEKQIELTPENQTSLIHLALGIDPHKNIQSGCVSIKCIDLVLSSLTTSSLIKSTLEWMAVVLKNPVEGFNSWKSNSELSHIYREFPLLTLSVLMFIENECPESKSHKNMLLNKINEQKIRIDKELMDKKLESDFHARLKKFGSDINYYDFSILIMKNSVNTDFLDQPITTNQQRYNAEATCFREAILRGKTAKSWNDFGILIQNGYIKNDLENQPINDNQRYEVAATYYRESIKKGKLPKAYYNLGILIDNGLINTNIDGRKITTDAQRYNTAANCYREVIITEKMPSAYYNLGQLIQLSRVNHDLNGKQIKTNNQRHEASATCYREAIANGKLPQAYYNLGVLIHNGYVNTDLDGKKITTGTQRYKTAATCYREVIKMTDMPDAYNNLGLLIQIGHVNTDFNNNTISTDIERYKTAATYFEKAIAISKTTQAYRNLARSYILYDFNLTPEDRLSKIKEILRGQDSISAILALAYELLGDQKESNKQWKNALINGCSSQELNLVPQKKEDAEESSDEIVPPFFESSPIYQAREVESRSQIMNDEENAFKKIGVLIQLNIEKLSKPKPLSRIDLIKKHIQPKIEGFSNKEQKIRFTENAYTQFLQMDQNARNRFHILIEGIEVNDLRGNPEILSHEDKVDNAFVMTRRLTQTDRLAYTHKNSIITILSLVGHYR